MPTRAKATAVVTLALSAVIGSSALPSRALACSAPYCGGATQVVSDAKADAGKEPVDGCSVGQTEWHSASAFGTLLLCLLLARLLRAAPLRCAK